MQSPFDAKVLQTVTLLATLVCAGYMQKQNRTGSTSGEAINHNKPILVLMWDLGSHLEAFCGILGTYNYGFVNLSNFYAVGHLFIVF